MPACHDCDHVCSYLSRCDTSYAALQSQVFYSEHYKRLQPATLTALDKILESRLYITGKFSAPDVSVASVLVYAELSLKVSRLECLTISQDILV